jgi:hypothetical protein
VIHIVEKTQYQEVECFECEKCGFHYEGKELAEKCEKFCREKGVCSFEVTTKSLEREAVT